MNNQEAFDRVVKHLAEQKQPSRSSEEVCAYRGVDGRKCAVGCLIPDEAYQESWEGLTVESLFTKITKVVPELAQIDALLLIDLQTAHDRCVGLVTLRSRLRDIANRWRLDCTSVDLVREWDDSHGTTASV